MQTPTAVTLAGFEAAAGGMPSFAGLGLAAGLAAAGGFVWRRRRQEAVRSWTIDGAIAVGVVERVGKSSKTCQLARLRQAVAPGAAARGSGESLLAKATGEQGSEVEGLTMNSKSVQSRNELPPVEVQALYQPSKLENHQLDCSEQFTMRHKTARTA